VENELLVQADRLVGGNDAVLVIDDTAIPKKRSGRFALAAEYLVDAATRDGVESARYRERRAHGQ
jgi:hypothetical protein